MLPSRAVNIYYITLDINKIDIYIVYITFGFKTIQVNFVFRTPYIQIILLVTVAHNPLRIVEFRYKIPSFGLQLKQGYQYMYI